MVLKAFQLSWVCGYQVVRHKTFSLIVLYAGTDTSVRVLSVGVFRYCFCFGHRTVLNIFIEQTAVHKLNTSQTLHHFL